MAAFATHPAAAAPAPKHHPRALVSARTHRVTKPSISQKSSSSRHVIGHSPMVMGASAAAIAAVASEDQVAAVSRASGPACGSMLMPAAALKQVSRGFSSYHSGVDLMAPYGSPIRAAMAGRVVFAGWYFGYGNMVDIQSASGVVTRYGHMSAFAADTRSGHLVTVGETIGQIGTSGEAHGPHVHFEVRIGGHAVDPKPYLALSTCPAGVGPAIEEAQAPDAASDATPGATPARQASTQGRPGGIFQ